MQYAFIFCFVFSKTTLKDDISFSAGGKPELNVSLKDGERAKAR